MWDDRHAVFASDKQHGQDLVDAAEPAGVDLTDVDGTAHQELLEHDAVLAHLPCCDGNAQRLEGFFDSFVSEDIVGRCGFFDEPGLEGRKMLHVGDGFGDGPDLNSVSQTATGPIQDEKRRKRTWFASTINTLP